jgi:GH24 family phage-related lysozyme (muramidase)
LFERTDSRFEDEVKGKFPDFTKSPKPAQEALVDMAYNLGTQGLVDKFPKFVAVGKQD